MCKYKIYFIIAALMAFSFGCEHGDTPFGPGIDTPGAISPTGMVVLYGLLMDDFNDGDFTPSYAQAGTWVASGDDFSVISHVIQGTANKYLRVDFEVKSGVDYPAVSDKISFSPDQKFYSDYNAFYFKMRGSGNQITITIDTSIDVAYNNYFSSITTLPEWTECIVPFDSFNQATGWGIAITRQACLDNFRGISFGSGSVGNKGWFEIDDFKIVKFTYKR